ncbi:NADPH-dependent D-xylose reductase II,III [[Candida] anglica]|uniref:NADPH-dependent D-xylose reductase II,III n=1 Tax=[Candida] anglica TaxID=148631 RepID=A0ABP0EBN3_9ASCO
MSNLTTAIQLTRNSTYKLNNGLSIPIAGYGVYQLDSKTTKDLVYRALEDGYRHIDSAAIYGNEKEAAEGIAAFLKDYPKVSREDIWFTTKIWNEDQGYEETKKGVQKTADKVKPYIGYVDLFLLHSPLTSKDKRLGSWKALQEFVSDPSNDVLQIKSIGVSNFGIEHIEELLNWEGLSIKPVVNQLELHPWLPHLKLRKYCLSKDILLEAYSPLTQGHKLNDPELLSLEKKFGVPKVEILLKWSYLQGFIVLAKTEKFERIKQNLSVLPDGQVEDDQLEETKSFGKVDLEEEILQALDKPESHEVLCWGNKDPTEYKD